ncbi:MAG: hypothetical protein ACRYHQ_03600 [Janthinobacterium lividum]
MDVNDPLSAMALPAQTGRGFRALQTGPLFWLAMLAASALGTNLGDLFAGRLELPGVVGFGLLVAASVLGIAGDWRAGRRTELYYWIAIVVLRGAATNVADFLTEDLRLGFVPVLVVLAVAALLAGARTRAGAGTRVASPVIDGWYWTAMLVAGVFGTVGGDLMNHSVGLFASAGLLTAVLLAVLAVRGRWFPAAMLAYWVVVLAERCAGTPIGDGLASRRGVGLGLQVATACTAVLFGAALAWRAWVRNRAPAVEI